MQCLGNDFVKLKVQGTSTQQTFIIWLFVIWFVFSKSRNHFPTNSVGNLVKWVENLSEVKSDLASANVKQNMASLFQRTVF